MDFIVNDLSIQGQFPTIPSFKESIDRVMKIRQIIREFGGELFCHKSLANAQVTSSMTMPKAVNKLTDNERRALLQWMTRQGPFWNEARQHTSDDWFECNGSIVTDYGIGEAAWCCLNGIERNLVSFIPSDWEFSPVPVDWIFTDNNRKRTDIGNFWDLSTIEEVLRNAPTPVGSWENLEFLSRARFTELTFSDDAFDPLNGLAFVSGAADRIIALLDTLNKFKASFDDDGNRTPVGQEIYQNFFTGKKGEGGRGALFTDSSEPEKRNFRSKLTFKHPTDQNSTLFCPWHGKTQTPQMRIHFSYPIRADEPLYVVYVGEKRTKK